MKKIAIFDYLRALSVFLVVYFHLIAMHSGAIDFIGPIANSIDYLHFDTICKLTLQPYVNFGQIGVAMFFLLSGFLIMKSREKRTMVTFIKKRILRIYPICIVGTVLSVVVVICTNFFFLGTKCTYSFDFFVAIILNSFLVIDLIPRQFSNEIFGSIYLMPVFWFLLVLIKFYFIVAIFDSWDLRRIILLSLALLLFVSLSANLSFFVPAIVKFWFDAFAFSFHHIIFILLGCASFYVFKDYMYSNARLSLDFKFLSILFLLFLFFISFQISFNVAKSPLPHDMLKNYMLALFVFFVSLLLSPKINRVNSLIAVISKVSFSVYVTHYALCGSFLFILQKLLNSSSIAIYCFALFLVFLFGGVVYYLFEAPMASFLSSKSSVCHSSNFSNNIKS